MRSTVTVTPAQLPEVLLHVAVVRPVLECMTPDNAPARPTASAGGCQTWAACAHLPFRARGPVFRMS